MSPTSPPLPTYLFTTRLPPDPQAARPSHTDTAEPRHPFTALYQQHVDCIYRYHLARTGDVNDAQDLTAETFHAALENYAAYNPARGNPAAWLSGIARHKLADHYRRSRRVLPIAQVEDQPDPAASPEEASARGLQMAQVSTALRKLPTDRAEALSLHFFAGLSQSETAQVMHKSNEAVKKLIHRGLADLRAQMIPAPPVSSTVEVTL